MNPLVGYEATFTDGTSFSLSQTQAVERVLCDQSVQQYCGFDGKDVTTTSSMISSPSSILMDADKFEAFLSAVLSYQRGVDVESIRRIDHAPNQSRKDTQ